MFIFWLLLIIPPALGQGGCGTPRCGGMQARPYLPPLQPYPPQYQQQYLESPQMTLQRPVQYQQQQIIADPQLLYTASYVQPTQVLAAGDKDLTTPIPELAKLAEYEKFEEKLGQLKAYTEAPIQLVEAPPNVTSITYIREQMPVNPSLGAQPYLSRPMPYRPHPLLPKGCPVLPPQYYRPTPFMPRGYVTPVPVAPLPLPVPPAYPAPLPQPAQPVYPAYPAGYSQPRPLVAGGYVQPPPLNDCCGRCATPCHVQQHRAQALASKTVGSNYVPLRDLKSEQIKDPRCSSDALKDIMIKGTTRTAALSKRIIQKVAEEQIGGFFSVFCSREDFSYVARSEVFCQTTKNDIICYAFQHN